MVELKPGWKTTEFLSMFVVVVVSILVMSGVLSPTDANATKDAMAEAIKAAVGLVSAAATVWGYLRSRTTVKEAVARAASSQATLSSSSDSSTPAKTVGV